MLISSTIEIGNKLFAIRKRSGLTQANVAEMAGVSDRTYADIERGTVNMRVETILRICDALHITPDEILTADDNEMTAHQEEIMLRLNACSPKDKETALRLLSVFLQSLNGSNAE
jgi:transcriptional regulator with XRE-family HTH domain